jgi:hypothetical protein
MAAVNKWLTRGGLAAGVVVAVAGGLVALNWQAVRLKYAAHRYATAGDDRGTWAAQLLDAGEDGADAVYAPFAVGDAPRMTAVVALLKERLPTQAAVLGPPLVKRLPTFPPAGQAATLDLLPDLLESGDPAAVEACRGAVRAALTTSPEAKVRAVALALRPEVGLLKEVAPLLADGSPEVRRAAVLAVGPLPAGGEPVASDDDLSRCLHDPDAEVREAALNALFDRGLTPEQVALARRLTDPDPAGRLGLLVELRRAAVANPGPWLERLSKDTDPAVRLGAARVAAETRVNLRFAKWLHALADADPDPTVRKWAGYYRAQADVQPAGFDRRD